MPRLGRGRAAALASTLTLALAGCPATGVPLPSKSQPPAAKPSKSPGIGPTATPGPDGSMPPVIAGSATPAPAETASPIAPASTLPILPAGPTTRLSGTVALDRAYVLSAAGGGFISEQGGGLMTGGNNGTLIVKGAPLISDKGGALVAANPAQILSNHGASLTGKVKLLANNGGNIVANNGGGYRLAQATATAPVGGMLVAAYSLALGGYLPIGQDDKGQPVWATYTDSAGRFAFDIPQAAGTNVLIVASAAQATDPRLAVDLVVSNQAVTNARVDGRTTAVSAFLRRTAEGWMEEVLAADPCKPEPDHISGGSLTYTTRIKDTFAVPAFQALPPAGRRYVIARVLEQALATLSLPDMVIIPGIVPGAVSSGPALPVLEEILGKLEAATAARLAENPAYFDKKPYLLAANLRRQADQQLAIRTPSDIGNLVVEVYMATVDTQVQRSLDRVLLDLKLDLALRNEIRAAGTSVLQSLIPAFAAETTRARSQAFITEVALEAKAVPGAATESCPAVPSLGYDVDVTTLAGGTKGFQDGAGAQARFTDPTRLLVDGANRLIVAEGVGRRLRAIDLADPTHPVRTLAGTGVAGTDDGPGAVATFGGLWGLALGGPGELFLADAGGNRVRKVTGYDGTSPVVSTLAGSVEGFADGPGPAAKFNEPVGLVRGRDGLLYVVDAKNHRLRRIDAAGAVETVAGAGLPEGLVPDTADGPALQALFDNPRGAALGPDGALYLTDGGGSRIRRFGPEGLTTFAGTTDRDVEDGPSDRATFSGPSDLVWLADGSLVVADAIGHRIRLVDPQARVYTLAGGGPWRDKAEPDPLADGAGATARFNRPTGLAVGPDGTIYVADSKNHRIRAIRLRKRG